MLRYKKTKDDNMINKRFKLSIALFIISLLMFCLGIGAFSDVVYAESTNEQNSSSVPVQIYNPTIDTGYTLTNKVSKTVFNSSAYTSLRVNVEDGDIIKSTYNGFTAYGVTGTSISLKFKINYNAGIGKNINGSEYMLCDDSAQSVNGITTGEIDSGAIIIQTSTDGKNWSNDNKAKYTNGLYTTNYYTHYNTSEQTIYTPDGQDVSKGVYIRVLYAYEVYDYIACTHKNGWYFITGKKWEHDNDNVYKNYVEEYSFYLCYNSTQSVTFHNLSIQDKIEENMKDEDSSIIEIAKKSETLINGSVTTTGFKIDKSLNEAATVTVKRNGENYIVPTNNEIKENGRYDITVITALGEEETTTIYVHNKTKDELYSLYFGEAFLNGKRIYSKESLPTYEGGLTNYVIQPVANIYPMIWGTLTNKTNGNTIKINPTTSGLVYQISEPGEYEAVLNTNSTYNTSTPSGDNQSFIFKFNIIANGSAPGPQVNKESLQTFTSLTNPSNLSSTYYGVTFQSAHSGFITLAFSTEKAAIDYAYNYEKGMVEDQGNGTYRYTGNLVISQKVVYDNAWDLTDAVYYFAKQAVQKLYFNLSDEFTYLTLEEDLLEATSNLRTLELAKSVVIFANDNEKANLLKTNELPIINSQKYAFLLDKDGDKIYSDVESGNVEFMFVKDANGYDSNKVTITDSKNNSFNIEYNKSLEQQLKEFGCETGIITIKEETIYGDITTYQAIYISENDNTSKVKLNFNDGNSEQIKTFSYSDNNSTFTTSAFTIKDLTDELDSCSLIIVEKDGTSEFCSTSEKINKIFTEKGAYNVTVLNRLGYKYSFTINIETQIFFTTELSGEGIDGSQYLMYEDGDMVSLPTLTKYGYNFVGYRTSNGETYSDEVQAILLKGSSVLETVWVAKQFQLSLQVDSAIYEEKTISFGETYTLPVLESTSTQKFVGWKNSQGAFVTSFTVETEGDVSLLAHFEPIGTPEIENSKNMHWLTIILMCVGALILMGVAHYIISEVIMSDYASWMWIVSIILLAVLLIFVPLPWWALSLIEVGGIAVMVGFIAIVEKY